MSAERLPPLAVYVHFPWCVRKCPYCDFNSHALRGEIPESAYIDALLRDLEREQGLLRGREIISVFLGGGTPSLFRPEFLARLLEWLARHYGFSGQVEITLEANPGAVERERFAGYRAAGINRISLGVQSFDDAALQRIGRIHDAADSLVAYAAARTAGFVNINLDLMFALPGQTAGQALGDLQTAVDLAPEHLSLYQLTIEPNTRFAVQPPPELPDHDSAAAMQDALFDVLVGAGYQRYEISAHARDGRECRHNLNYWQFGDYLGIGAGAHGKITGPDGVERYWKQRQPQVYLEQAGHSGGYGQRNLLQIADLRFEFLMNALRLRQGFQVDDYHQRTGLAADDLLADLKPLAEAGWLEIHPDRVQASDRGYRYLDELLQKLLP